MKTVHVFTDVDMRMGHEGLEDVARGHRVSLKGLEAGEAAVFISRNRMRMKAYSWNGVVSYLRAKALRPFDLSAVDEFAKAFSPEGVMDYDKAIKKRLEKLFGPVKEERK
jgi:hypothetical protein